MREYPNAASVIRIEMVRCGYTMQSLSDETEISTVVLREILSGRKRSISTRNICLLAKAFGFSASEFLDLLSGSEQYSACQ